MNKLLLRNLLLSLLFALSLPVLAAEQTTIKVKDAWARESPPAVTNGAAYMTLINAGSTADRLVSVAGDIAESVELHTHLMEEGMMKMRPVASIEIDPGKPMILRPGELHVMLIGLKQPLVAGHNFSLRLHFEKAGEVPVVVTVRKTSAEE